MTNAKLDLEISGQWFPVEQEAWQKLEQEEQAKKPTRSAGKVDAEVMRRVDEAIKISLGLVKF